MKTSAIFLAVALFSPSLDLAGVAAFGAAFFFLQSLATGGIARG